MRDRRRPPPELPRRLLLNREHELSHLGRVLAEALRGRGQVVLVKGEAGIGKTSLAQEFARRAARRGARILWGRSGDRDGSPPYWPWTEAIRQLAEADRALTFSAPRDKYIRLVLPELRKDLVFDHTSLRDDESVRFHVADAVRGLFQRAARSQPILLLLEDLHWADQGSLFLLEFIAQNAGVIPLVLLATYRDDEITVPLDQTLAELARSGAQRITLQGLTLDGTGRLIARIARRRLTPRLVRQVHARTDGNPFFVTEIARLDARHALAIPDNVRMAIARRMRRLSESASHSMVVAAVIGREFDFPLLRAALEEANQETLLQAIDEGLTTLVIEPLTSRGQEWYQFRHALIREALYESIAPGRRARWHATIARKLEALPTDVVENRAAELAFHAAAAGELIEPALLAKYSCLAGERLLTVQAFSEALGHFERAWRAREGLPIDAAAVATLVGLGRAQAATAPRWNRQTGWLTLRRAIDYYLKAGETGRAVAVAIDPHIAAEGATDVAAAIRRIQDAAPPGSLEEGWLLARLGAAEYFETGDYAGAQAALARALRIAAAANAPALELRALAYGISIDHFDLRWPELLEKSRRVRELAQRVDDLRSETYARFRAAYTLTHTGRPDQAAYESDANLALAERLKDRGLLPDALYVKSMLAFMSGSWREARASSDRALAISGHQIPLLMERVLLECETGHRKTAHEYLQRLVAAEQCAAGPWPLAGVCLALTLSQVGCLWNDKAMCDAARRASRTVLDKRSAPRLARVLAHSALGLVSVRRPEPGTCEEELEFLEPFQGMLVTPSLAADRLLGSLAHGAGQTSRAIDHFENALAFCRRSGHRPEMAWTMFAYSKALLDMRRGEHQSKAAMLLEESHDLSRQLGMPPLSGAIVEFRRRFGLRLNRKPIGLTSREMEVLELLSVGRTNKEIGNALSISTNTVAIHVARVLSKTGSSNRTEAASYAARHHLIGPTQS